MFIQAKDKLLSGIPITDNLSVRYLGLMYKNNCKPRGLELSLTYLQAAAPGLSATIDRTFRRRESTVPLSSLQQLFGVPCIWSLQSASVFTGLSPWASCTDKAFGFRDPLIHII